MAVGDFRDGVWPKQDKLRLWYKTRAGNRPGLSSVGGQGGAHYKSHREWSQWDTDLEEEEEEAAEGSDRVGSSKSTMNGIGTGGDHDEIITEIDVLYGENRPFWSFERVKNGPVVERKPNKWEMVDVVVRRGNPGESSAPEWVWGKYTADTCSYGSCEVFTRPSHPARHASSV